MFVLVLLLVGLSASYASPLLRDERAVGSRIVGGRDAAIEEVPYHARLVTYGYSGCGASIISESWVVSAAHCLNYEVHPSNWSVRAGTRLRESGGVTRVVEMFIIHPDYNSPAYYSNDIGLLKVVEPFEFSAQIQPLGLPTQLQHFSADTFCVISGFGMLSYMNFTETDLQMAEVPVVPIEDCRLANYDYTISDDMLCAGFLEEGGVDACSTDSGGPLAIDGVLQGVVSWGVECALPGRPGVYARVSYFVDWINEHTGLITGK